MGRLTLFGGLKTIGDERDMPLVVDAIRKVVDHIDGLKDDD